MHILIIGDSMNLKKILIHTIIIFLLCVLFHFGYDVFPNFFTSIFSPVNESIWEHLKMLFTASVVFSIATRFIGVKDKDYLIKGYLRGMFSIIILLFLYLPIYYLFGEHLIVTLIILGISIFISEWLVNKLPIEKHHFNVIGAILIILNFIIFTYLTYHPVKIDLFYDHNANKYGIDILK